MSTKDYLEEHKKLIETLLNPTKKKLKDEAKEQINEIKRKGLKLKF